MRKYILAAMAASMIPLAHAQPPAREPAAREPGARENPHRPPLFFKEDWQQSEKGGEHALSADSVGKSLELKQYVPSGELSMTGKPGDESNPVHVWTGLCTSPCAFALRDKTRFADLSDMGRIRLTTKVSGFHKVRPIVKLADGTWLVGDRAEGGSSRDWLVSEISFGDLRWIKLDIARVVTVGTFVDKPDLTKVDEIGFADLMPSSGHGPGGWADVAQIEVFGKPVERTSQKENR